MRLGARNLTGAALVLSLAAACVAVLYAIRPPDYRCDEALQSLLVDVVEFPPGSSASTPSALAGLETNTGAGTRACETNYSGPFGHAFNILRQYDDEEAARRAYSQLVDRVFQVTPEYDLPFSESPVIAAAAIHADEVRAGCTDRLGMGPQCAVLARYGRLVSLFQSEMSPSGITADYLVRILERMDTTVAGSGMEDPQ